MILFKDVDRATWGIRRAHFSMTVKELIARKSCITGVFICGVATFDVEEIVQHAISVVSYDTNASQVCTIVAVRISVPCASRFVFVQVFVSIAAGTTRDSADEDRYFFFVGNPARSW